MNHIGYVVGVLHSSSKRFCALMLTLSVVATATAESPAQNPLESYVKAPDDAYEWSLRTVITEEDARHLVVDLVSQEWLSDDVVDRTKWQHTLIVTVPAELASNVGLLAIGGGSNREQEPPTNPRFGVIAKMTGMVVAELRQVPNQPLQFHDDGRDRYEDDLIAYAWKHYLTAGDSEWLPRGPMVKAAVRAMDAVTAVMKADESQPTEISEFIVAGGSKRGWTAWITGAFDDRVVAIAPLVIDVLNIEASMRHHFAAYGFWAPAIADYVQHGLMHEFANPRLQEIYRLVDPLNYVERLQMPKLILNAAGDQYFLPDSSRFYWEHLKGPKYLRYVPNADHGLDDSDAIETLAAFAAAIARDVDLPHIQWSADDGVLTVTSDTDPIVALVCAAQNFNARDFRVATAGRAYACEQIWLVEDGSYRVPLGNDDPGWTAQTVELTFDIGVGIPLKLSTAVYVTPETLPYEDKNLELPTSVTVVCTLASNSDASAVQAALADLPYEEFSTRELTTIQDAGRIYINWTPSKLLVTGLPQLHQTIADACPHVTIQLESGPEITLPPGSS